MSTTGYTSLSVTKESGAPAVQIPAGDWFPVFEPVACSEGPNIITGQVYFEGCTPDTKIALRVSRGNGNPTGQDDRTVTSSTWAISYFDLDFVQAGKVPKPSDFTRGLEVWVERACVMRTHNLKILNPGAYIAARITVETGD